MNYRARDDCRFSWPALPVFAAAVLATLSLRISHADEIYRWTDDDGVVHFSDTRPQDDADVTVLDIAESSAKPYDAAEDPYSILNQAARIHQNWLELEAASRDRAEARQVATERLRADLRSLAAYTLDSTIGYLPLLRPDRDLPQDPRPGGRQLNALRELELLGPRPYSINSAAHRDRVQRSQALPLVAPATGRR